MVHAAVFACVPVLCAVVLETPIEAERGDRTLQLPRDAVVQTPTISLWDLLPPDADPKEQEAARKILLGRAPQPGSVRVFTAKQIETAVAGSMPLEIPAEVTVRRSGWPIRLEQVRAAFLASRTKPDHYWNAAEISLPKAMLTRSRNADLQVVSVQAGRNAATRLVTLRCADHSDCGPFLAVAHGPVDASTNAEPLKPKSSHTLVRPGRKAALVIAGDGIRMVVPVLPLKRGSLGDVVRVLDPAAHRILVAQVSGENALESTIEGSR